MSLLDLFFTSLGLVLLFNTLGRISGYRTRRKAVQDRPPIYDAPEFVDPTPVGELFPFLNLGFNDPMARGVIYVMLMGDFLRVTNWRHGEGGTFEVEITDQWLVLHPNDALWFCKEYV